MRLRGERVTLRALEPADAAAGHRWITDPEVLAHLEVGAYPVSVLAEEEWYRQQAAALPAHPSSVAMGIEDETGRYIGNIGLHRINWRDGHAVLGILIGEKDRWDQGYGTEAIRVLLRWVFGRLRLHRVWLVVNENNHRVRRCYEKVGFVVEGRWRQHVFRDGRHVDQIIMGILAPEFTGSEPPRT